VIHSQVIEGTSLRVMFCAQEEDIYRHLDTISSNGRKFGVAILLIIAFFYGIYFFFLFKSVRTLARKISAPVRRIVEFSSQLGKDTRLHLEKSSIDELETLNGNLESTHHKLIQLVNYDPTTKLINHRKLREDIDTQNVRGLFLFHIKSYAQYNNLFGPIVGNAVLMHVIGLIQDCKTQGALYQENKDTIALVISDDMSGNVMKDKMQMMLDTISNEKFTFEGIDINITVVGSASLGSCDDGLSILSQAHIALSKASEQVTGKFVVYDEVSQITKLYEENILWGQRVKDALLEGRFEAFFQPIQNYKTQEIQKCEALVRMHLDGEIISPFKFLDAAKNIGKLHEITLVMIDQVFEVAKAYPHLEFSINTSFDDFEEGRLVDYVKEKLLTSRIEPSKIIFEILETQTFSDQSRVIQMISELKTLGFKIAIDDFGTGHSNFAHVTLMEVDYIKIDGMFIKNLDTDVLSQKMVTTLVYFTQQIGAKTIAEFVHNEEVYKMAEDYGVDFAQGYHISKPLSEVDLKALIKA
ncbi:MAG: EAL domain-containing protein, partial [Thiovulaceae bacterium]|nr:EAL domain-containing protein [Sulfurimonadaceae bacterium]